MRKAEPEQGHGEKDGGVPSKNRQASGEESCRGSSHSLAPRIVAQFEEVSGGGDGKPVEFSGNPQEWAGFLTPAKTDFYVIV